MNPSTLSIADPTSNAAIYVGTPRTRVRQVLIASPDSSLREKLRNALSGLRWHVLEAAGGSEAWVASEGASLEAILIDPFLPDLEVDEFLEEFHRAYPTVDMLMTDGEAAPGSPRSPFHQEILYALRRSLEGDSAAFRVSAEAGERMIEDSGKADLSSGVGSAAGTDALPPRNVRQPVLLAGRHGAIPLNHLELPQLPVPIRRKAVEVERIPELIGESEAMLEVSRRIRLVAARTTPVLIEGPTGSGKELVAEALHRLSARSRKPFVAINCAAIPEALLEAELFGHTRGAFTGAVQGRIGRIESADGGTLFLDEIGELPLALQSKLLRFFESGELQRIGDNETVKVDVRLLAATHRPLAEDAQKGLFRADLYYRLAVFLIRTPALLQHMDDLPHLVSHFVESMGRNMPVKQLDPSAMSKLASHSWPGNVRELEHVLERAAILAGDEPVITVQEIDFGNCLVN
jgi:DNA-binding NtrC family response regulator